MTKVRDGLYGLIVADALGVPAESRTREDLRSNPITGRDFQRRRCNNGRQA